MDIIPADFDEALQLVKRNQFGLNTNILRSLIREINIGINDMLKRTEGEMIDYESLIISADFRFDKSIASIQMSYYKMGPEAQSILQNTILEAGYSIGFSARVGPFGVEQPRDQMLEQLLNFAIFPALKDGADFRNHDDPAFAGSYSPRIEYDCVMVFCVNGDGSLGIVRFDKE